MRCSKCGTDNGSLKRCCANCGAVLSGFTVNNVTGEYGYRNPDGSFTKRLKLAVSPDSVANEQPTEMLDGDGVKALVSEYIKEFYHDDQPWVRSEITNFLKWLGRTHVTVEKKQPPESSIKLK